MQQQQSLETDIVEKTKQFVQKELQNQESGHGYEHIERVYKLSVHIAQKENNNNINLLVVQLGALLHDIADHKFHDGDEEIGPKVATEFLQSQGVDTSIIDKVVTIIRQISFKGAKSENKLNFIEGLIVQDADRLDAIGAIGIGRTFNYGGYKGRYMYDPNEKPVLHSSFEEYKKNSSCTINHFYEKLLLLKDGMNTQTGKDIALDRHQFMELFLQKFFQEWNVEL